MTKDVQTLIQSYYRSFNEKNFEGMLALVTEGIIHDTNQGSRTKGKDAFRSFLAAMDEYYDERLEDIVVLTEGSGRRAAAEFICNGIYKKTSEGCPPARGQTYRLPVGCFFEIEDGRIARITNYYNLKDWLEQVQA